MAITVYDLTYLKYGLKKKAPSHQQPVTSRPQLTALASSQRCYRSCRSGCLTTAEPLPERRNGSVTIHGRKFTEDSWNMVPSGKLSHNYGKSHHFNGKTHYKWSFSIAMLNYQRVDDTLEVQDLKKSVLKKWKSVESGSKKYAHAKSSWCTFWGLRPKKEHCY